MMGGLFCACSTYPSSLQIELTKRFGISVPRIGLYSEGYVIWTSTGEKDSQRRDRKRVL